MLSFLPKVKISNERLIRICVLIAYPLALLFFFGVNKSQAYIDSMGIQIALYVMLAWGLSIVVGSSGLLSLNYVVAYAVGAYSYIILGHYYYNIFPLFLLPLSAIISGFCGLILGLPSLRFRGDYLAVITLVLAEVFQNIFIRWTSLTKGKAGIYASEKLMFLGIKLEGFMSFFRITPSLLYYKIFFYYLLLGLCFLAAWIILRLRNTSIGNGWRTIRDNPKSFSSYNTQVVYAKLSSFVISSMFAGVCGALFSASQGFVSPRLFTSVETIIIFSIVVLGGMTSLSRIAEFAIILIGSIELLCGSKILGSFLKFNCSVYESHNMLFAVSLFLVMLLRSYSFNKLRQPSPFLDVKK